ncbi:hypothetical protein NECID01_1743 [Nematocida sp. AWRm77]|nr:hypothetical protein NECID01_1743 [Nematocida sp. AWRm77]
MGDATLFRLFGTTPEKFSLEGLKEGYYMLMKKVHPDAVSSRPLKEKEHLAGFLSAAYQKLKDPYTRSVYVYSLENKMNLAKHTLENVEDLFSLGKTVTVVDSAKNRVGCDKKTLSPEFLDTVLSMEEEIEEGTKEEREALLVYIDGEIEKCKSTSTDVQSLVKWKYFNRLRNLLVSKEVLE